MMNVAEIVKPVDVIENIETGERVCIFPYFDLADVPHLAALWDEMAALRRRAGVRDDTRFHKRSIDPRGNIKFQQTYGDTWIRPLEVGVDDEKKYQYQAFEHARRALIKAIGRHRNGYFQTVDMKYYATV